MDTGHFGTTLDDANSPIFWIWASSKPRLGEVLHKKGAEEVSSSKIILCVNSATFISFIVPSHTKRFEHV